MPHGNRFASSAARARAATRLRRGPALGAALAEPGFRLVYGAGDVGLMGAVARAAIAAGGETLGVIPAAPRRPRGGRRDLSRFVVTETMHERKKVMFMNADAIVTLPGGPGSLDELFEVLTWRQLGLHRKPVHLLNVNGYWDPLLALLDHLVAHGFADPSLRDFLEPRATVPELDERPPRSRAAGSPARRQLSHE